MKFDSNRLVFSPSDLVRYLESPFSSWMDRFHLENPGVVRPDELSEDARLMIETGNQHERNVLEELKGSNIETREIPGNVSSVAATKNALAERVPIIYQAKLEADNFGGYADFIIIDDMTDNYQIWDTKLARSPKPYLRNSALLLFGDVCGNDRRADAGKIRHHFRRRRARDL